MIECGLSINLKRFLNICLGAVLLASLLWAGALATPTTAQAQVEEAWILPETISSGLAHTCGIRGNGTLTCWGRNDHGQATPPTGTFRQVSAGRFHTCGLRSNGTVACWGEDLHNKITPPAGTFVQLSAGDQHTCGVRNSGALYCWGKNDDGQTTYPTIGIFKQVSAGHYHSCGLYDDGSVYCWGATGEGHNYGQAPINILEGPFTQITQVYLAEALQYRLKLDLM